MHAHRIYTQCEAWFSESNELAALSVSLFLFFEAYTNGTLFTNPNYEPSVWAVSKSKFVGKNEFLLAHFNFSVSFNTRVQLLFQTADARTWKLSPPSASSSARNEIVMCAIFIFLVQRKGISSPLVAFPSFYFFSPAIVECKTSRFRKETVHRLPRSPHLVSPHCLNNT